MKPIGPTRLLDVSATSASASLSSTAGQPVSAVLVTNLTSAVVAYAAVATSTATVVAPSTSTATNLVPILGLSQTVIELESSTTPATVFVNAIAGGSATLALTPLF